MGAVESGDGGNRYWTMVGMPRRGSGSGPVVARSGRRLVHGESGPGRLGVRGSVGRAAILGSRDQTGRRVEGAPCDRLAAAIARRDVPQKGEGAAEQGFGRRGPIGPVAIAFVEQLGGYVVKLGRRVDLDPTAAAA